MKKDKNIGSFNKNNSEKVSSLFKTFRKEVPMTESLDGVVKLVGDLTEIKQDVINTVDEKIQEIDSAIEGAQNITEELNIKAEQVKETIDAYKNEAIEVIKEIKQGEPGKDGIDADEDKVIKAVLAKMPKGLDEKTVLKKLLEKLPNHKASLKVIQEKIEVDPMSVIEKIMALPEGKFTLKTSHITGLEQTMAAFRSQLGKGYLHGGGASLLSQLQDVTITSPAAGDLLQYNGTKWINTPFDDNGILSLNGLTVATQTFAVGTSGSDFNISSATSTHTFNLPTASATVRGALSTADWTTFNSKPTTFLGLTDTPSTYVGQSLKNVRVNAGETALEFYTLVTATTLADVSFYSTDATKSLYTMTSTIPVNFQRSGGSSLLYLDETNGRIGIGTSSPDYLLNVLGTVDPVAFVLDAVGNAVASSIHGRRARGTVGSKTAVQSGDNLMINGGMGYGATAYGTFPAAQINYVAAENWTDTAQGGYISLRTQLIGTAAGSTERVRITDAGEVIIGKASTVAGKLSFNNTTNAFTQTLRGTNPVASIIYDLPTTAPTAGQYLSSTAPSAGVATLSWSTISTNIVPGTTVVSPSVTGSILMDIGGIVTESISYRAQQGTPFLTSFGFQTANVMDASTALDNSFFGYQAGVAVSTGDDNTLIGFKAGITLSTGSKNTFIGSGAAARYATGSQNIYIGVDEAGDVSSTNLSNNIIIGNLTGSHITGSSNVIVGDNGAGGAVGAENTILGFRAMFNTTSAPVGCVAVGAYAGYQTSGDYSTYLGYQAQGAFNYGIALGYNAIITADNQMVIGGNGGSITDSYIGNGVTHASPAATKINATGGSGSNIAGASLTLAGGKGTGSGAPGVIIFQTSVAAGSSSTLQSLSEAMRITATQTVGIGTGATVSAKLHVISTTEQLRTGYDASNYVTSTTTSVGITTINAVGSGAQIQLASGGTNVIWHSNGASGQRSIHVGWGSGDNGVSGDSRTAIGYRSNRSGTGTDVISIGAAANYNGQNYNYSLFIGSSGQDSTGMANTAANQAVIGMPNGNGYTTFYLGQGVSAVSGTPTGTTIYGTPGTTQGATVNYGSGDGSGTDKPGGNTVIFGGRSTGSAAPGDIIFQTTVKAASSATLQSLSESGRFINNQGLSLEQNTTTHSVFVGKSAGNNTSTGTECTALGYQAGLALTSSKRVTAIGYQALTAQAAGGWNMTAIGAYAGSSDNNAVGDSTYLGAYAGTGSTGEKNVFIGLHYGSGYTSGSYNTVIGTYATGAAATSSTLAIGAYATTTVSNQAVIGAGNAASGVGVFNTLYFNGVTVAAPAPIVINAAGGSGSNIAGASLTFAGGKGTGSGAGGSYVVQTSTTLGTGTTLQTLVSRLTISGGAVTTDASTATWADKLDFVFNTGTGTKIGTAASQKISLWNATPNVQPTTAITAAAFVANTSGIVDDSATFGGYTLGQIVAALQRIGALA